MAARNVVSIIVQGKNLTDKELSKVNANLDKLGAKLQKVGGIAIASGAAIGTALFAVTAQTAKTADEVKKFERATGVNAKTLSALAFAVQRWGGTQQGVNVGLRRLTRSMFEASTGAAEYKDIFDELSVSVLDGNGKLKSVEEILPELAEAFRAEENAVKKAALAQDLFGRSGLTMVPLLNQGAEGLERLTERADRLGILFSTDTLNAAEQFQDSMLDMKQSVKGVTFALGKELLPIFIPAIDSIVNIVISIKDWVKANEKLGPTLVIITAAILGAGGLAIALGTTIRLLASVKIGLATISPTAAIIVGAVAGIALLTKHFIAAGDAADEFVNSLPKDSVLSLLKPEELRLFAELQQDVDGLTKRLEEAKKGVQGFKEVVSGKDVIVVPIRLSGEDQAKLEAQLTEQIARATAELDKLRATVRERFLKDVPVSIVPDDQSFEDVKKNIAKLIQDAQDEQFLQVEPLPMPDVPGADTEPEDDPGLSQRQLFEELQQDAAKTGQRIEQSLSSGFTNAFAAARRGASPLQGFMAGIFTSIADQAIAEIQRIVAEFLAKKFIFALLSGGTSLAIPGGGGVADLASFPGLAHGGTILSGTKGIDNVLVRASRGETVISNALTDKLDAFLDAAGGESGGLTIIQNIRPNVMTASAQEAARFARETERQSGVFERTFIARGER